MDTEAARRIQDASGDLRGAVPAAAYALFTFGSPNPNTFAESQRILAEVRLPHHAEIDRWFAVPDAVQLAWVAIGLVLLRRSPLLVVLLIAAATGLVLTLLQYTSGDHTFALLFPCASRPCWFRSPPPSIIRERCRVRSRHTTDLRGRGIHHRRTGRWRNLDHGSGDRLRHR